MKMTATATEEKETVETSITIEKGNIPTEEERVQSKDQKEEGKTGGEQVDANSTAPKVRKKDKKNLVVQNVIFVV